MYLTAHVTFKLSSFGPTGDLIYAQLLLVAIPAFSAFIFIDEYSFV